MRLLLLATVNFSLAGNDLSEHHNTVAIEESNTRETLAVLEGVDDEWLMWGEVNLRHLVGLEGVWLLHLLTTGLLTDLPLDLGHTASSATAADETDRGITNLDLTGDIQDLDLGVEVVSWSQRCILLVDHHITSAGHVLLVKSLDIHADVVTRASRILTLVVHLDGEDLTTAGVGSRVGWEEANFLTWLDATLLDTAGNNISDTLDLVDTGNWQAHGGLQWADWWAGHLVQSIVQAVEMEFFGASFLVRDLNIDSLPPRHVCGRFEQVVTNPTGDWEDWGRLEDEVLLPADLLQHVDHLVGDLIVAILLVSGSVAIHLVHANDELLHTEQVDKTRVLTSLTLDLTGLVVTTLDGSDEVTIGWDHDKGNIGLGSARDHVLDEITMSRGIDDGVVPLVSVEFLGCAGDGHTTFTLLLLTVHVESEGEGTLTETLGLLLELLQLTFWKTSELEQQTTGGGGLAGIDVSADDDGQMLLLTHGDI